MFSDFEIFYNIFYYITADKIIISLTNAINIRYRRERHVTLGIILRKNINFLSAITVFSKYTTREERKEMRKRLAAMAS